MLIRKLSTDDALIWKTRRLEALANHPENFLASYEEEHLLTDDEWKQRINDNDVFGIFEDKNLMATVCLSSINRSKSRHIADIWGVYTHPDARGKGYAYLLMQHVLTYAKEHNILSCRLTCTTTNVGAFHIYEKLGFRVYGTETKSIKVAHTYYDEYLMNMQLRLEPQPTPKASFFQKNNHRNTTQEHFDLLKSHLVQTTGNILSDFKDLIYHDVHGGSFWQAVVRYFRLICYYVFSTGRYQELANAFSTLNPIEKQQLMNKLDTNDITAYMLTC